ncbi:MAG: H-X9-DG-CTERM domain-containing protein, partial [Planctomycetota bacterium]
HCGSNNAQATVRSRHQDGAFTVFADGSVHFISDYIDCSGGSSAIWSRLIAAADGLPTVWRPRRLAIRQPPSVLVRCRDKPQR